MYNRTGKSTFQVIVLLFLLSVSAVAAGWFLYIRPYYTAEAEEAEIAVQIKNRTGSESITPKVTGAFTDDDREKVKAGIVLNEFKNPLERSEDDQNLNLPAAEDLTAASSNTVNDKEQPSQPSLIAPEDDDNKEPDIGTGIIAKNNLNSDEEVPTATQERETQTEKAPVEEPKPEQEGLKILEADASSTAPPADIEKEEADIESAEKTATIEENRTEFVPNSPASSIDVKTEEPSVKNSVNIEKPILTADNKANPKSDNSMLSTAEPDETSEDRVKKRNKVYVINALSTQDGDVARKVMDELRGLPHRVYAYQTVVKGKNYYRIRIGFFDTYEEAASTGQKLSSRHKLPKPWIVTPGREELKKYRQ